jgi:hypothetical protein
MQGEMRNEKRAYLCMVSFTVQIAGSQQSWHMKKNGKV